MALLFSPGRAAFSVCCSQPGAISHSGRRIGDPGASRVRARKILYVMSAVHAAELAGTPQPTRGRRLPDPGRPASERDPAGPHSTSRCGRVARRLVRSQRAAGALMHRSDCRLRYLLEILHHLSDGTAHHAADIELPGIALANVEDYQRAENDAVLCRCRPFGQRAKLRRNSSKKRSYSVAERVRHLFGPECGHNRRRVALRRYRLTAIARSARLEFVKVGAIPIEDKRQETAHDPDTRHELQVFVDRVEDIAVDLHLVWKHGDQSWVAFR
jgi:hypothetical protein